MTPVSKSTTRVKFLSSLSDSQQVCMHKNTRTFTTLFPMGLYSIRVITCPNEIQKFRRSDRQETVTTHSHRRQNLFKSKHSFGWHQWINLNDIGRKVYLTMTWVVVIDWKAWIPQCVLVCPVIVLQHISEAEGMVEVLQGFFQQTGSVLMLRRLLSLPPPNVLTIPFSPKTLHEPPPFQFLGAEPRFLCLLTLTRHPVLTARGWVNWD